MSQQIDIKVHFHEIQQFRQRLLWILLLSTTIFIFIVFVYGMVKQIILGETWGTKPMSDTALAIVGSISILFMGGLTSLFYVLKLITEVKNDGLYIQFFPFSRQKIPFDNIKKCEVRQYSPIKEYGGWGIRWGRKGKAYNVSGNRGVQLELLKGKPILIGSQRPEELAQAITIQMKH
jgi:hypothetical protein